MDSNYTRIFIGNKAEALRIVSQLQDVDIVAVVKDEAESARLAGFSPSFLEEAEVFVHNDELERTEKAINS